MILASLLRNRFVDLPDRDGCQSAIRAVAAGELADMAALTASGHGRKTFLGFHILGEVVDETLILRNAWPLQSAQKTCPSLCGPGEVSSGCFGGPQFVVAGLAVRPAAS